MYEFLLSSKLKCDKCLCYSSFPCNLLIAAKFFHLIPLQAKDSAYSSEYFIQALKMSDSTEELEVVVQQVNAFMDMLRGRDTGGQDG